MNNKRSASRKGYFRARRGYSLLELMLALSMAAVLAAVGVPAFTKVSLDNRRAAVANELLASLMLARSEAEKRGQDVVICGISDGNRNGTLEPKERRCAGHNWTDGWVLGFWNDTNEDNRVDDGEMEVLHERLVGEGEKMTITAGNFATTTTTVRPAGTAVLRSLGRRSSNGTITICDRRGSKEARAVIISPNGRARVSSRKAEGGPLSCP